MRHGESRIFLLRPVRQRVGRLPSATQLLTPRLDDRRGGQIRFLEPGVSSTEAPMIARLQFYHMVPMRQPHPPPRNIGCRCGADQVVSARDENGSML